MDLLNADALIALTTLTAMEIVLGIDNIVFIAILVARLPIEMQAKARSLGITLALVLRLGLLFSIKWLMGLGDTLFTAFGQDISGRDLILLSGGLFLVGKATYEIHHKIEDAADVHNVVKKAASFGAVIAQILVIDIVFSLDSVITAVGMAKQISIMVIAMVLSMIVMLLSANRISAFIERHPTVKVLALSFLILIGVMLVMEGSGQHVNKSYIYFAMAFSLGVEMVNMKIRSKGIKV